MSLRHGRIGAAALLVSSMLACRSKPEASPPVPRLAAVEVLQQAHVRTAPRATTSSSEQAVSAPSAAPTGATGERLFAGTQLAESAILEQLQNAAVLSVRPVGNTSTVFKATLKSDIGAAFKAATVKRPRGPHSEIAAYRLSRCLGLHNVAPAVSRRLPLSLLRTEMEAEHRADWSSIEASLAVEPDKRVLGAAIYWIDSMQNLALETAEGQARITAWLSLGTEIPSDQRELASQVSTMLAFDYLIGNWDRWSGGNVKGNASGNLLYMRDHDAGFAARLSEPLLRRILAPLLRTERFSRSFYLALRSLSREALRAELALDTGFGPGELLDDVRIEGLFERRETLLSHIAASIEQHGEVRVLAFP